MAGGGAWRSLAVGTSLGLLAGCGGGGSPITGPSSLAPRTLAIVSGTTGVPVAGARVSVGGRATVTDGSGRIFLDGVPAGSTIDIAVPGFLQRQTYVPEGGQPLTLWPLEAAPTDYVLALVYVDSQSTHERSTGSAEPLMRVTGAHVSLVPSAEILGDPRARAVHEQAVAEINAAAQGRVVFSVDEAPAGDVVFRISTDASVTGATTYRDLHGDTIVGGRIAYGDLSVARDLRYVAHELGHVLGLQHSTRASDMMYYVALAGSPSAFAPGELATIAMLLQRRPGTQYPDNERVASASAFVSRTNVVVN